MDLVQVKIKGTVITNRYGTLTSGDVLRTDAAFAKHLVEECGAAEYINKVVKSDGKKADSENSQATTKTVVKETILDKAKKIFK